MLHGDGHAGRATASKTEFVDGVRLLGELGLSFDLCMRPAELPDATSWWTRARTRGSSSTTAATPTCKHKDHAQWKKDMAELAKRENVVGKVCGHRRRRRSRGNGRADDLAPVVNHTLEVFGPDRVMFGGDWPVCMLAATYRQWVEALKAIVKDRKAEEQRKLFHDNAVKFYGLE